MKTHDRVISIIFMLIMAASAVYWAFSADSWTILGTISAVACLILFVLLGVRVVPAVTEYISVKQTSDILMKENIATKENLKRDWITILAWVLGSRVLLFLLAYAFLILWNGHSGGIFEKIAETWHLSGIDASHYLDIAENWYVTEGDAKYFIVFLPLLPILIKFVHLFAGNYLVAGFIVSNLCSIAAALFAYRLALLDMGRKEALRVVKYIFIFPAAFFFLIPMTESLFLMLSLMCIYFVRKQNWLLGCLFAALASFTRSPGVLLAVPVAIEMARALMESYRLKDKRAFGLRITGAISCLALISVGLLAYLYINYRVTGNPLQFSIYQKEHWFQRLYFFFDTARYQMEYVRGTFLAGDYRAFLGLWLPNLSSIFIALIIMFKSAKKLHPSYTAYFIVYFAYIVAPTWLLSAPRYLAVAFPLAFAVVLLTNTKAKDAALTVLSIAGSVIYLALFVAGFPVY